MKIQNGTSNNRFTKEVQEDQIVDLTRNFQLQGILQRNDLWVMQKFTSL